VDSDDARRHHRAALADVAQAAYHRGLRDDAIRRAYAGGGWSYTTLADAVGCTRDLVAKIIRPQR
jgi:ribosome-binding protein aMBF1 (putative translation factor)